LPPELKTLHGDIDFANLRVRRPSKFLFFCGGTIGSDPKKTLSLRQYLLNERKISPRIRSNIILAETANQLYRDSGYVDLITFEEDIARISALVLVIAESPGSLAELGAFASRDAIRRSLAILIRTTHYEQESFIRYGPIEKLHKEDSDRVGVYPWRTTKTGLLVKSSARSHVRSITTFTNKLLDRIHKEHLFESDKEEQIFICILWIVYLSTAVSITQIVDYYSNTFGNISMSDMRNKLFCMKLAGWVSTYTYVNKTYWYANYDIDPFSRYAFLSHLPAKDRDSARRKSDVVTAIRGELKIPKHVRELVAKNRKAGLP
jgi:hypothetical protein